MRWRSKSASYDCNNYIALINLAVTVFFKLLLMAKWDRASLVENRFIPHASDEALKIASNLLEIVKR